MILVRFVFQAKFGKAGEVADEFKKNIEMMAKMFITGEDPEAALKVLKKNRKAGLAFTVDLLGEATLSEVEAEDYQNRYLELLSALSKEADNWSANDITDRDSLGDIRTRLNSTRK